MTSNIEKLKQYQPLLQDAENVQGNSHSPYSGVKVGAALKCKDGKVFSGCNVENLAYGSTMCAERVAIYNAVSSGYKVGDFEAIAIFSTQPFFSPCGSCRQVINEFGDEIVVLFKYGNKVVIQQSKDLTPYPVVNNK